MTLFTAACHGLLSGACKLDSKGLPCLCHSLRDALPTQPQLDCAFLQGIGDAVAAALALTTALGGAKHASRAALAEWLAADLSNRELLQQYLLTRWDMHRGLRLQSGWLQTRAIVSSCSST